MPGAMDNILDQLSQSQKDAQAHDKAAQEDQSKALKSFDDLINQPKPPPPDMPDLPAPPQQKGTSTQEAFGSIASAFAIFGSLLTRHPLTSALHASAAAMNAIHANDAAGYQSAYDAWKTNIDYALKVADYQQKRYSAVMDSRTADVNEKLAYLKAMFTQDGNWSAAHAAETGDLKAVGDILYKQQMMSRKLTGATAKLGTDAQLMQQFITEFEAKNGRKPNFDEMAAAKRSLSQAGQTAAGKAEDVQNQVGAAGDLIDSLEQQVNAHDWVAGGRGIIARGVEGVRGFVDPNYKSKSAKFESDLTALQNQLAQLAHSRQATKQQIERMDTIIRGLGAGDNKGTVLQSLDDARKLLGELKGAPAKGASSDAGDGASSGDDEPVGPFNAILNGAPIHSDDGETWFDADGNLVPND